MIVECFPEAWELFWQMVGPEEGPDPELDGQKCRGHAGLVAASEVGPVLWDRPVGSALTLGRVRIQLDCRTRRRYPREMENRLI